MLPGTFMYVYLGSIGRTAAAGAATSPAEWALRAVGLGATIVVTVYVARLARHAIQERTTIESVHTGDTASAGDSERQRQPAPAGRALVLAAAAAALLALAVWATVNQSSVRASVERGLGLPPTVTATEAYATDVDGPTFDHGALDDLLGTHVDQDGWVDYDGLRLDVGRLDAYLTQVADAPFETLGRDEKLALLINAYNAFTLRLILDHYPVASIRDIPEAKRWDAVRWRIGRHTWSLNQIEHERIRPKFAEPRIHFALVCAAVGCPPLRTEAYVAARLDEQLASQTTYVHAHPRWVQVAPDGSVVSLTALYDWYGSDFTQHAASVLHYAAQFSPAVARAMHASSPPALRWLDYDWRLNSLQHHAERETR